MKNLDVLEDRHTSPCHLQDSRLPNYISEVIQFFFESSNSMLDTIRGLLLVPEVDFVRIAHLGDDLKQGAAPLGAVLVVSHCDVVSQAGVWPTAGLGREETAPEYVCYNDLHQLLTPERLQYISHLYFPDPTWLGKIRNTMSKLIALLCCSSWRPAGNMKNKSVLPQPMLLW